MALCATNSIVTRAARRRALAVILLAGLMTVASQARVVPAVAATTDWLDHSFGGGLSTIDLTPGKDIPADMAVMADGRVVIVATTRWGTYESDIVVMCLLPDGRTDTSFGEDGRVVLDYSPVEAAIGVALQPDGMIVVAGGGSTPMLLARMDGTGRLDPAFSGGVVTVDLVRPGFDNAAAFGMALAPDGKIMVSASLSKGSLSSAMAIRFNPDGSVDQDYGDDGFAIKTPTDSGAFGSTEGGGRLVVLPDGAVVVAGTHSVGSVDYPYYSARLTLTRFSPTGVLDAGFGDGGVTYTDLSRGTDRRSSDVGDIAAQPDGKIVVVGSIVHTAQNPVFRSRDVAVTRFLADGHLDPGFGAAGIVISPAPPTTTAEGTGTGNGMASAVSIDGSGRILVGGFAMGFTTLDLAFVRYTPTGALDQNFGRAGWAKIDGDGREIVKAMAIQPDGRAVFAGTTGTDASVVVGRLPAFVGGTTVTAWGWNGQGQLGDDSLQQHSLPVPVTGPTSLATPFAGSLHSMSLQGDRTVTTWGWNGLGQLGDGTTTDRDAPIRVPGLVDVTAVAAGTYHSLAVSGGRVYAWGWNGVGQLGDGTVLTRLTPVVVPGLTDVVEVSAGMYHSLARRSDGTVWAWGWNGLGQLGDGTTVERHRPIQVPGILRSSHVSAGALHSIVVAAAGEAIGGEFVWGWGYNGTHQVDTSDRVAVPTPRQVLAGSPVAISAGAYHNVVLNDDGVMYAWGWNALGQLGNGTTSQTVWATRVVGLTDATSVSAGLAHTLATDSSGRVWGWGWNELGQLGDGTTTNRASPTLAAGGGAKLPSAGWLHSLTSNGAR